MTLSQNADGLRVLSRAADWIGNLPDAWHWYVHSKVPSLGNWTPIELVEKGHAQDVIEYINMKEVAGSWWI